MSAQFKLKVSNDMFGGKVCELSLLSGKIDEPATQTAFQTFLGQHLDEWRTEGSRGIWIKVSAKLAAVLPSMIEAGFRFHHAQAGYVMMIQWLPTISSDPDVLPEYCTQTLGVGGLCMRMSPPGTFQEREVLVIVEKFKFDEGGPDRWKLPGGAVDPSERISDAVEREVLEETGIKAFFRSVVCVQHTPKFRFGRGDMYVVCRLEPIDDYRFQTPQPQAGEIEKCCWMPVSTFLSNPSVIATNRRFVAMAVLHENRGIPHMILAGTSCILPPPDDPEHPDAPPPMRLRDVGTSRPVDGKTKCDEWREGPSAALNGSTVATLQCNERNTPAASGGGASPPKVHLPMSTPVDGGDQGVPQTVTPKETNVDKSTFGASKDDMKPSSGAGASGEKASSSSSSSSRKTFQYKTDVLQPWPHWSRAAIDEIEGKPELSEGRHTSAFGRLSVDEAYGLPMQWRDGRAHWYSSNADGQKLLQGEPCHAVSRSVAQCEVVYGTKADACLGVIRLEPRPVEREQGVSTWGSVAVFAAGMLVGAGALWGFHWYSDRAARASLHRD